jgi:hypothetical protein
MARVDVKGLARRAGLGDLSLAGSATLVMAKQGKTGGVPSNLKDYGLTSADKGSTIEITGDKAKIEEMMADYGFQLDPKYIWWK